MAKKAFTMAEIMIVLTIVGILTAIILPVAKNSMPDKDVMKFKKANATLNSVINELVNSDKYYLDGDLGVKPDGTLIDGTHPGDDTYFCETFADVLTVKSVDCSISSTLTSMRTILMSQSDLDDRQDALDTYCRRVAANINRNVQAGGTNIITSDGVSWWLRATPSPFHLFGMCDTGSVAEGNCIRRFEFGHTGWVTSSGFESYFVGLLCIDIDGIPNDITATDCINECPFGYGLRVDGKIYNGTRADEWIKKSMQNKE